MIKQTIFLTLAANFIWMLPAYQSAIKSRRVKEYNNLQGRYDGTDVGYKSKDDLMLGLNPIKRDYYLKETNLFNRKPFTCLYCITFWLGVSYATFSTILSLLPQTKFGFVNWNEIIGVCGAVLCAPVLSVALNRWFNSLHVKL